MTRPSDRAIAQAFWELAAPEKDGGKTIGVGVQFLISRARELDATAAPVVVGEVAKKLIDVVREYQDWNPMNCERDADLYEMGEEALAAAMAGD